MAITVIRDQAQKMKHTVHVRQHEIAVDEPPANGDAHPDGHTDADDHPDGDGHAEPAALSFPA